MSDNAISLTVNHGVALLIGFIFAIILEQVVQDEFTDGTLIALVADNVVILYVVLLVALFAIRMSSGLGRSNGMNGM